MDLQAELDAKVQVFKQSLEEWARENNILPPTHHLSVDVKIAANQGQRTAESSPATPEECRDLVEKLRSTDYEIPETVLLIVTNDNRPTEVSRELYWNIDQVNNLFRLRGLPYSVHSLGQWKRRDRWESKHPPVQIFRVIRFHSQA